MQMANLNTIKALLLLFLSWMLLPAFSAKEVPKAFRDRKGDLFLVLERRYFKQSLSGTTVQRLVTKCLCSSLFLRRRLLSVSYIGYSYHNNDTCTLLTSTDPAGNTTQYILQGNASETGDWKASSYERGARLVIKAPNLGQLGTDGLLYYVTPGSSNLDGCRSYCSQYVGFRLAQAKTNLTMGNLRKHGGIYIDLSASGFPTLSALIWGDGTPLDPSILRTDLKEPIINQNATEFVVWPSHVNSSVSVIDDCLLPNCKAPCLCQGNFANVSW